MQRCFVLGCCFIPLSASSSPALAKDANPLGLDLEGGQFRALCCRAQSDRLFLTLAASGAELLAAGGAHELPPKAR